MANYAVKISLSPDTVKDLKGGSFKLYGFKAVSSSRTDGVPVIWYRTATFNTTTDVRWATQYEAYVAQSEDIPNGHIEASASVPIDLFQKWNYRPGSTEVVSGGQPGSISVLNQTKEKYACGISEQVQGVSNPLCAFPLFGGNLNAMAPIQKVLLMFATDVFNTGTVIYQAFGPAILIDLTAKQERGVSYDINEGWDWGKASWAKSYEASAELTPLLIEHSQKLANFAFAAALPEAKLL